jgi:hypothetical protein
MTTRTGAAPFAVDPFQMLFGNTIKMATTPAHVTLPGLMANLISILFNFEYEKLSLGGTNLTRLWSEDGPRTSEV